MRITIDVEPATAQASVRTSGASPAQGVAQGMTQPTTDALNAGACSALAPPASRTTTSPGAPLPAPPVHEDRFGLELASGEREGAMDAGNCTAK